MRVDLASSIARFKLKDPVDLFALYEWGQLVRELFPPEGVRFTTQWTEGTLHTVPPAAGYLLEADTVTVVATVTEVTEQHLVLVRVVVTLWAVFAVRALPVVWRDKVEQLDVESYAGRVTRRVTLWAAEQNFGQSQFVTSSIALAVFASGSWYISI
jgi:hypothetical protein